MRTYKTLSVTFPPALHSRALAVAEREQRSMSELMREAFRTYESVRGALSENEAETTRRIKASLASVKRGDYTDYDESGLRNLGKNIIAGVRKGRNDRARK